MGGGFDSRIISKSWDRESTVSFGNVHGAEDQCAHEKRRTCHLSSELTRPVMGVNIQGVGKSLMANVCM